MSEQRQHRLMESTLRTSRSMRLSHAAVHSTRPLYSIAADFLTFIVAACGTFTIHLVGEFPVSNILLIMVLPLLLLFRSDRLRRPRFKVIFILLGLWLFNQIVTDVYRRTDLALSMRTDARILFAILDVMALAMLVGKSQWRQALTFAGVAVGAVLQARFQPMDYMSVDRWKFGYAVPITYGVVLLSCYFYRRRLNAIVLLLLVSISCVHLVFNFRSPVLFLLMTGVLVVPVIPERIGRMTILPASSGARVIVLVIMALIVGKTAGSLVLYLSSNGYLGQDAAAKNAAQSRSKLGLLISGRPEILISSIAVADSPILGHGSGAIDYRYVEIFHQLLVRYDIAEETTNAGEDELTERRGGAIPTHSHLMGAWVEAGIMGAVFWGYVFYLTARGAFRAAMMHSALGPIVVFSLLIFLWSILFSPGGGITVLQDSFTLIVACNVLESPVPVAARTRSRGNIRRVPLRQHARTSLPAVP